VYGASTTDAVKTFQQYYGLPVTGVMNTATWNVLNRIYSETVEFLPEGYSGDFAKLYPGYVLSEGMSGSNIRDLQTYLSIIGQNYESIPTIPVTGYFGTQTRDAVIAFQNAFGINPSGVVGAYTWNTIANQYDFLISNINS
jgi:peptidoglycan hydrolase-like protein with peptidoglycan-binding domain